MPKSSASFWRILVVYNDGKVAWKDPQCFQGVKDSLIPWTDHLPSVAQGLRRFSVAILLIRTPFILYKPGIWSRLKEHTSTVGHIEPGYGRWVNPCKCDAVYVCSASHIQRNIMIFIEGPVGSIGCRRGHAFLFLGIAMTRMFFARYHPPCPNPWHGSSPQRPCFPLLFPFSASLSLRQCWQLSHTRRLAARQQTSWHLPSFSDSSWLTMPARLTVSYPASPWSGFQILS